jgi:type II secretion system protein N
MRIDQIDWTVWKPRLAYGAFAAFAFLLALRWTFPAEAVKERLIFEAGARGWQIDVDDVSAGGLLGVTAEGVKLESSTGLAIPIEEITASLRILPLLVGRRSISFDARIYDGRVRGTADLSGASRRLVAEVKGVDLARALPLRKASGMDLFGTLAGSADLTIPEAPNERPTGQVEARVSGAGIAGGQLPIAMMSGTLTLPRLELGELTAEVKLADGKATFDKLEAKGGDAELRTEGVNFIVQPRMEYAPIFGKAKLKIADAFWSKSGTQMFKGLTDMALGSSRGSDGAWNLSLMGSVGHPRMQPVNQGLTQPAPQAPTQPVPQAPAPPMLQRPTQPVPPGSTTQPVP